MPDPTVDASFELLAESWEDPTRFGFSLEETCTVLSVVVADGAWTTEFECGDEPGRLATLTVAAPLDGSPSWSEGEVLFLDAAFGRDEFGGSDSVQLHRGEELLVHALRGNNPVGAPLPFIQQLGADPSTQTCHAPELDDTSGGAGPLALRFERDGDTTTIIDGHRGSIELGADQTLEIDVARATSGSCCHGSVFLDVLMRVAVDA